MQKRIFHFFGKQEELKIRWMRMLRFLLLTKESKVIEGEGKVTVTNDAFSTETNFFLS